MAPIVVVACVFLPLRATAAPAEATSPAADARCNGSYCVTGGTTTVTLSAAWQRQAAAAGLRLQATAPAVRRGSRLTFPIARTAVAADGYLYEGARSAWYLEGCDVVPGGGGVFHRGGALLGGRRVRAVINGPRLALEIPEPGSWKTGQKPKPYALVFAFARWSVLAVTSSGFRAEAQLRVSTERTKGMRVPSGVAGTLSLDVRVTPRIANLASDPSCAGGPISTLPRVSSGVLYPLLAGSIPYGTPLKRLYEKLGRPPCNELECGWSSGPDHFGPLVVPPVDGRTGVEVLWRYVQLSTENVKRSRLQGWRSPEGVHIGSTLAELRRAYPAERTGCLGDDCALGFVTRPYPVAAEGGQTRQRFSVAFNYDRGEQLVKVIKVDLIGEEGTCKLDWLHERDYMEFDAKCFGPLVSARLEPVGASPRFTRDPQTSGVIASVVDDAGRAITPGGLPDVIDGSATPTRATWRVKCNLGPFYECPPGRGAGPVLWQAGGFEEWELMFRGYSPQPALPKAPGAGPAIPPMRFVAEFLGRPSFTIVISRHY